MNRTWWGVVGVLVVLGIGALFFSPSFFNQLENIQKTDTDTKEESPSLFDVVKSALIPNSLSVVAFGEVGPEYGGARLADTILLVHFLPDQKKGYMISIPRDLWISDGEEQFKINEVLFRKKIPQALLEIKDLTGIEPDGYTIVNLSLVRDAVDFLEGVDVTLDAPAIDWVSGFTLPVGTHHLDGEDAVWLLRNRYNREGDFFREKNQQKVVEAAILAFQKLPREKKLEFIKKFVFTAQVLSQAHVDFSKLTPFVLDPELAKVSLEHIILDYETGLFKIDSVPLHTAATTTYVSVVLPSAGFERYEEIRAYIQNRIMNDEE